MESCIDACISEKSCTHLDFRCLNITTLAHLEYVMLLVVRFHFLYRVYHAFHCFVCLGFTSISYLKCYWQLFVHISYINLLCFDVSKWGISHLYCDPQILLLEHIVHLNIGCFQHWFYLRVISFCSGLFRWLHSS